MLEYSGLGVLPVFSQTVGGCLEVTRKNMLGCEENFPILPTGLASTVYRTGWAWERFGTTGTALAKVASFKPPFTTHCLSAFLLWDFTSSSKQKPIQASFCELQALLAYDDISRHHRWQIYHTFCCIIAMVTRLPVYNSFLCYLQSNFQTNATCFRLLKQCHFQMPTFVLVRIHVWLL